MDKRYEIDMTTGSILPKMITFFVPLLLANMLQLMFNAVDLMVVGRFTGSNALAAVGSTTSLIHMMVNLFAGISLGANVQTAKSIARHNDTETSDTVQTAMTTALISGTLMVFIGWGLTRKALTWMGSPAEIIDMAATYMYIYFAGMPFFMLYTFGSAILRAAGDTKRPMFFLAIAGVLNAGLNVFLVVVFHLGVIGVGVATVFSQMVSCVLTLRCLRKTEGAYRFDIRSLKICPVILKQILQVGLPTGIQTVVISFSNVLLQTSVNSLGADAMAGYTAAGNVQGFLYVSCNSITQACMTFTSQNYGANKPDRIRKVLINALGLELAVTGVMGTLALVFGETILGIYSTDPDVVYYGMEIAKMTFGLYFICGIMDCVPGALRGLGHATATMIVTVLGTVGFRIIWIFFVFPMNRTLHFLFINYPASWTLTAILQSAMFLYVFRKERALMEQKIVS